MTTPFRLTTPVAFIVFDRPDTTKRVFAAIAAAKPRKLLVVGDGPRAARPAEAEVVAEVRSVVSRVDWDCEVLTNFSDVNLGCKQRVSSGLSWVFEQVEEAMILEDDCLPDPTFFRFCQEMLERYRHDRRVGMVSRANFQFGQGRADNSYYFSKYSMIWGWGSWRDRWLGTYDVALEKWPRIRDENALADMVGSVREGQYWQKVFEKVHRGEIDTWDYQWFFANFLEGRLSIVPTGNLISNIGYGKNATHTTRESRLANMTVTPMTFPVRHPAGVFASISKDRRTFDSYFQGSRRLRRRIRDAVRGLFGR